MILMKIPKQSYPNGFTDDGISDVVGNPNGFRYSELFLKRWYEG